MRIENIEVNHLIERLKVLRDLGVMYIDIDAVDIGDGFMMRLIAIPEEEEEDDDDISFNDLI